VATKPNSGISFEDIKRTTAGYIANARIFIQDIGNDGKLSPVVTELKQWESVSAALTVEGVGAAHITFNNNSDQMYRRKFAREWTTTVDKEVSELNVPLVGPESPQGRLAFALINGQHSVEIQQLQDYYRNIYLLNQRKVKFLNPRRRADVIAKTPGSVQSNALSQGAAQYINEVFEPGLSTQPKVSGSETANLVGRSASEDRKQITQTLMQRVYVDFVGRDGRVYAGFSGVLSSVHDIMIPGQTPTSTWIIKDYWRLFQLTEFSIITGAGQNLLEENIAFETQGNLGFINYYMPNVFSGLDGVEIIHRMTDIMQGTFCENVFLKQRAVSRQSTLATEAARSPDLFFNREPYIEVPPLSSSDERFTRPATYEGQTPLRRVKSVIFSLDVKFPDGSVIPFNEEVAGREDGLGIQEGDFVEQLTGDILIDKAINEGPQAIVYREMLDGVLSPYQSQRARGDAILKKVAESSFFNLFFNGNGDLVYQIPRYNNAPGEYDPGTLTDPIITGSRFRGQTEVQKTTFVYDFKRSGDFDFSPHAESLPHKGHGFNYVITDLSLEQWTLINSEEPIVTNVRIPTDLSLINIDGTLQTGYLTGITRVGDVAALQRRFGLRTIELPQIILSELMTNKTSEGRRGIQDIMAIAALNQLNGLSQSGTVGLTFRPDLELGKNVFLMERSKLYYLMGTTTTVNQGDDANTLLHLGFGHDIGDRIPNPWIDIRPLLQDQDTNLKPRGSDANQVAPNSDPLAPGQFSERRAGNLSVNPEQRPLATAAVFVGDDGLIRRPRNYDELQREFGVIRGGNNPTAAVKDYRDLGSPPADKLGRVEFTNGHEQKMRRLEFKIGGAQGHVFVHEKLFNKFNAAFIAIAADQITNPNWNGLRVGMNFRSVFNPRHVSFDVNRNLSVHSWGVAIDIRVSRIGAFEAGTFEPYHRGQTLKDQLLLVPIFAKLGFFWGGNFTGGPGRDDIHWVFADSGVTVKSGRGVGGD